LARPRRSAGEVTVCRGQATTPTVGFGWHDHDDGRYLVEHDPQGRVTIRPGTSAAVAGCIRTALNVEPQKEHP
ncbi:MAG TPA: ESX secretion-associated protein EspG, partial [Aldersonia sp.]